MRDEDFFAGHGTNERVENRPQVDRPCFIVEVHLEVLEEGATQYYGLIEIPTGLMIALVSLNQKIAYKAMLQGRPLVKQSLPRDRVPNIVVELDSEQFLFKRANPDKIINLLICHHAGLFEEAPVIVTFYVIYEIVHGENFLYLIKKVLMHRDVPEIIFY